MMFVYVISKDGQPLMPTSRFGKVRRLLKENKAKVLRCCPFTIKLLYEPKSLVVQEVVLGQDTGSKHIGTSCVANDRVLYQSQVELRDDIKSNMDGRRQARTVDSDEIEKLVIVSQDFLIVKTLLNLIDFHLQYDTKFKHILMRLNSVIKYFLCQKSYLRLVNSILT